MFHEYRDLISKLKVQNAHFARLFKEHNELDDKISNLEKDPVTSGLDEIDDLKRQKLQLKDEIYEMLIKESGKKF
ncbi:MAG: DUF465 domain-containing protein [Neisseriaceae bacterium]|nr:MAG: DUF465 domain-containing protein [Neisseriaceae bacterium]